jgi:uncharacterized protein (DUF1800 family)
MRLGRKKTKPKKHAAKHHHKKAKAHHKLTRRHRLHKPPARKRSGGGAGVVDVKSMTPAMVDRLFWRAGFGPTADDRTRWTGKPLADAVTWLLDTPGGLAGAPGTRDGKPLAPTAEDTDLVLSWIDRMVRATNPFTERLTFFWHRHWANSRESVSPPQLLLTQNALFRKYADFSANKTASFRDLAYEITEDPAMLRFLTGESNVRGAPNENYARELMELFGLGVTDANGTKNYSEDDVKQMAKALSGWQIDDSNPDAAKAMFTSSRWYNGPKVVFGKLGNYKDRDAVDLVLAHPAHAPFLITKLWGEFVATPLDAATRDQLVGIYTSGGTQLRPLLQAILTNPKLFDSVGEPNFVKPPVVYAVGAMRALGAGVTDSTANDYLDQMGQVPFFPPTVAGWEGGLSWMNTNTALARFAFVATLVGRTTIDDVKAEAPADAVARARAAVGDPWLADGTVAALRDYATRAGSSTPTARRERQLVLRTLILAGPDAQVM